MSQSIPVLVSATYAISVDEPGTTGNPAPTLSYAWTYTPQGGSAASLGTTRQITASFGPGVGRPLPGTLAVAVTATNTFGATPPLTASATLTEFVPLPILQQARIRDNATPAVVISGVPNDNGSAIGVVLRAGGPNAADLSPVSQFADSIAYQWRRDGVAIAGATGILYTIVADDIDTQLSVVVTASNGIGSAQQTAFVPVGDVPDAGFTDLTQFLAEDSRIVYVAANGSDSNAAAVYGRGYYLPSDPEIGDDPTEPAGAVVAYATLSAARAVLRTNRRLDNDPSRPRFPEWILFRRGDSFDIGGASLTEDVRIGGRSASERRVIAAYGSVSLPRPRIATTTTPINSWGSRGGGNWAIMSLDLRPSTGPSGFNPNFGAANYLLEDIWFPQSGTNVIRGTNVVVRRCVVSGNFNDSSHVQGIFVDSGSGSLVVEECVFDMNGYKEDPFDPSTWTRRVAEDGLAAGTGVQPRRTYFDRNMYLARYGSLHLRGNLISRGGGGGSVQMRVGGIAERNVGLFNETAFDVGHRQALRNRLQDSVLQSNLVLHDDHMLPPGGFGNGIGLGVGEQQIGIAADNVIAHFHRPGNSGTMLGSGGIRADGDEPDQRALSIAMLDNAIVDQFNKGIAAASTTSPSGIQSALIGGNAIARLSGEAASAGDASRAATVEFGTSVSGGNDYYAPTWNFSAWQASGYDPESVRHSSIEALATAKGWMTTPDALGRRGWERDIVSYMQSIDPTFVPNENVTVDDGVPAERRRPDAPRVWEVMSDPTYYLASMNAFWNARVMTEAQAKLIARRYHAFLAFIERAKENRKGAWDVRYTADALNNYIREGFGKAPVGGPYTADYPEGSAA